jgi:NAD(P)-dependent dehydrogenase (short-subunit alcohol dehydrogenase family)
MRLQDKVVVVTGGANGIGRALCERFARESAAAVVVSDVEAEKASEVAEAIGGVAVACDVGREGEVRSLVDRCYELYGRVDLFCSNAGIGGTPGGPELDEAVWDKVFAVNFQAHLWAARALVPRMVESGGGYLMNTISAAGLLTSLGSAPYAVTKHAALALAEWIRITYAGQIGVSCLCPQGVRTRMLLGRTTSVPTAFWWPAPCRPRRPPSASSRAWPTSVS